MARCSGSSQCNCVVHAGAGIGVTGAGTTQSPYVISGVQEFNLAIRDTATVDLSLVGTGSTTDPYVLSADANLGMHDLTDVSASPPSVGQVLAWDGAKWSPVPPATAAPGLIATTGCIAGDGSSGDPLGIVLAPNSGLACGNDGLTNAADPLTRIRWHRAANMAPNTSTDIGAAPDNPYFSSVIASNQVTYTALQTCLAAFLFSGQATVTNPGPHAALRVVYGSRAVNDAMDTLGTGIWRCGFAFTALLQTGDTVVGQFHSDTSNIYIDWYNEITVQPVVRTPTLIGS